MSIARFRAIYFFCLYIGCSPINAAENVSQQKFEAILGATRLIYDLNGNGESIRVKNPQTYPILIHSKIYDKESKEDSDFIITPPIFRLDAQRETDIRIVRISGSYPNDKESMKTLCVRGIPPKSDDLWVNDDKKQTSMKINVSINTCIKLILRPNTISKLNVNDENLIKWTFKDNYLVAKNKTPYYLTIVNASINNKPIKTPGVLPPFEEKKYLIQNLNFEKGNLAWSIIGDFGEISAIKKDDI
ncbi:fimbria/pilus periplasmic chaperone [Kosakonia sp. MUSA4]|uniref:fimbria/pilus periplasmic chaperone n=1 Tax=Kosakonia sp. MUSA4 TaxID=2067958 RepID=UPI00159AD4FC|nr:fimbria/pilus periplasmic chaperone [Kosakonia sp. MUSA4]QJT78898.1 molecular chaperone [Kosakonia sp. MUSA4]